MNKKIGLIAGNGQFPLIFAEKAVAEGFTVYVCAFKSEADPGIENYAEDILWIHVGQVKKIIRFFSKNSVDNAVMLGGIKKTRLFFDVRPDSLAIKALAKISSTHDDNILRKFSSIMEENGIIIRSSSSVVPDFLAQSGIWTKRKPSVDELKDIFLGYTAAKKIGEADIGQTVVVSGGSIIAVEAVEGTDETVKRGGLLSPGGGVVVKTSKPDQDMRFDIPSVGPDTLAVMKEAGIYVLAVESGRTNVLDCEKMVALADQWKMSVIGVDEDCFQKKGIK
ncbi:MAG: LpxI family protein [Thermodesulfobacteriota bacterium]